MTSFSNRTYPVSVLAFGRAVLYLLLFVVFSLCELKDDEQKPVNRDA